MVRASNYLVGFFFFLNNPENLNLEVTKYKCSIGEDLQALLYLFNHLPKLKEKKKD